MSARDEIFSPGNNSNGFKKNGAASGSPGVKNSRSGQGAFNERYSVFAGSITKNASPQSAKFAGARHNRYKRVLIEVALIVVDGNKLNAPTAALRKIFLFVTR